MDILLFRRPRLERWDRRPFHTDRRTARDHQDVYERDLEPESPGPPGEVFRRVAAAIRRYQIFPPSLVEGVIRRPVEPGDTVGIHYRGFPLVRLFFAARVVEVLDDLHDGWYRAGFRYRTLVGHPELGEETFVVEKHAATGRVRVALRSWSRPGTWLARLGAPVVRIAQVRASHAALAHLARRIASHSSAGG